MTIRRTKRFRNGVFVVLLIIPVLSPAFSQEAKSKGLPVGTWAYESQTIGGKRLSQSSLDPIWVEITPTSFIRCSKEGLHSESQITADPTHKPMEFQLEFTHPVTKKVSNSKGIYKIESDRLWICYDNSGKTRPTEFKSPDGEEQIVLSVLVRKRQQEAPPDR